MLKPLRLLASLLRLFALPAVALLIALHFVIGIAAWLADAASRKRDLSE